MRETQIMETLHHPHIVSMHAHFIDSEVKTEIKKGVEIDDENLKVTLPSEETEEIERWFLCIVMEHASRGDLLHLIERHKQAKEPISEELIWTVCN
jgi:serine/threonine protein kinase